ncbi:hypothetical protein LSTR_LSTR003376 [Laodelphax striatellus]|uniref:Ig-like domain-containing protein n=1 Tax=Laodelphax striatellus TaxID=195883 RepID=A0A482X5H6_LAOST|nr:hypothetical protein LSTR_LSTR003376 [Laodelphax striatellus]
MLRLLSLLSVAFYVVLLVKTTLSSIYHPSWQQYYPQRKWTLYEEQIHYRPARTRAGFGRYRLLPVGAELICDFPDNLVTVSNIIWERADLGDNNSLDEIYRQHGIQQDYILFTRPHGSTLRFLDITPLDRGLYRCIVTALEPTSGKRLTLFQDVHFYPIF